jgi:CheY-like chemotaxis protein
MLSDGVCQPLVLVVDDLEVNRKLLETILVKGGYQVAHAASGAAALEIARSQKPQLILLDVRMPGMDGYAVCAELKRSEQTKNIPVIFITAEDYADAEKQAFMVGGADFIQRPISKDVALARVKTHIDAYAQRRSLEGMFRDVLEFVPDTFVLASERCEPITRLVPDRVGFDYPLGSVRVVCDPERWIFQCQTVPTDCSQGCATMNILVVDGSDLIRSRLADRLRAMPGLATVVCAGTVRQAFNYLRSGLFDLAIVDLHLPDGTSSPIVGAMKQTSPKLAVAIYSNYADDVNRRLCHKAGADWFFDKSLEFDAIVQLTASLSQPGMEDSLHAGELQSDHAQSVSMEKALSHGVLVKYA